MKGHPPQEMRLQGLVNILYGAGELGDHHKHKGVGEFGELAPRHKEAPHHNKRVTASVKEVRESY